jgi:hypothetical protein
MSDEFEDVFSDESLLGTVQLAAAALHAPAPPPQAEIASRRRVEMLMEEAALSPRVLREAVREQPRRPWWARLLKR